MDAEYSLVSESEKATLCEDAGFELADRCRRLQRYASYLLATLVLSFLISIALIAIVFTRGVSDLTCTAQLSGYSPVLSAVEYEELNFDNDFLHQTPYRGPPTNHMEREWERLWNHDLMAIPMEEFRYLNKSADALYLEAPGGLAANLEVFHQLHCLNLIRQYTWKDYYDLHPDEVQKPTDISRDTETGLRVHVDHCIETLRLSLMCHGDVTPFLIVKRDENDFGVADFNNHHKCRKFDTIVEAFKEKVVMERWSNIDFPSTQYEQIPD